MYIVGDNFLVCDECGFKRRASKMRKNWKNQMVCADTCYEPRHPQSMVRNRPERIVVPNPRPMPEDEYLYEANETTLSALATKGATEIEVTSASGISNADKIAVELDNGAYIWTTVNGAPVGATVTLTHGLTGHAASGNAVYFTSSFNTVTAGDL